MDARAPSPGPYVLYGQRRIFRRLWGKAIVIRPPFAVSIADVEFDLSGFGLDQCRNEQKLLTKRRESHCPTSCSQLVQQPTSQKSHAGECQKHEIPVGKEVGGIHSIAGPGLFEFTDPQLTVASSAVKTVVEVHSPAGRLVCFRTVPKQSSALSDSVKLEKNAFLASKVRLDETKVRFVVFNRMFDSVDDCACRCPRLGPIRIYVPADAEIFFKDREVIFI